MQIQRIKSVKKLGYKPCLDFTVESKDHNFYANKILVSNSISYSHITAYTTYLKAKYPTEFFLSCLKIARLEADPIACITGIQNELRHFDIKLLPVDILKSKEDYSIEGKDIRMGLIGIKGLSEKALEKLKNFSAICSNKFILFQSLLETKIPINISSALILSGCFDSISNGITRTKLLMELELFKLLTPREVPFVLGVGEKYNYDLVRIIKDMAGTLKNETGKPIIKDTRLVTLRKNFEPIKQKYDANIKHEKLSYYIFEQNFLGFSYTTTLKAIFDENCDDLIYLSELVNSKNQEDLRFRAAVQVVELENRVSREKKKEYLLIHAKDDTAQTRLMLFGQERIESCRSFNGRNVKEGDIIVVNGTKKANSTAIFLESLSIQENPVVIKKSELLRDE